MYYTKSWNRIFEIMLYIFIMIIMHNNCNSPLKLKFVSSEQYLHIIVIGKITYYLRIIPPDNELDSYKLRNLLNLYIIFIIRFLCISIMRHLK